MFAFRSQGWGFVKIFKAGTLRERQSCFLMGSSARYHCVALGRFAQLRSRMALGRPMTAKALASLVAALSLDQMHAFAARMGSSALLPAFVKSAPFSLGRNRRYIFQVCILYVNFSLTGSSTKYSTSAVRTRTAVFEPYRS